MKPTEIFLI